MASKNNKLSHYLDRKRTKNKGFFCVFEHRLFLADFYGLFL